MTPLIPAWLLRFQLKALHILASSCRAGVAGIVNAKIKKTLDLAQLLSKNALSQNGYECAFVFLCVAMWLCPTAQKWPFACTAAPEDLPLKIYP